MNLQVRLKYSESKLSTRVFLLRRSSQKRPKRPINAFPPLKPLPYLSPFSPLHSKHSNLRLKARNPREDSVCLAQSRPHGTEVSRAPSRLAGLEGEKHDRERRKQFGPYNHYSSAYNALDQGDEKQPIAEGSQRCHPLPPEVHKQGQSGAPSRGPRGHPSVADAAGAGPGGKRAGRGAWDWFSERAGEEGAADHDLSAGGRREHQAAQSPGDAGGVVRGAGAAGGQALLAHWLARALRQGNLNAGGGRPHLHRRPAHQPQEPPRVPRPRGHLLRRHPLPRLRRPPPVRLLRGGRRPAPRHHPQAQASRRSRPALLRNLTHLVLLLQRDWPRERRSGEVMDDVDGGWMALMVADG